MFTFLPAPFTSLPERAHSHVRLRRGEGSANDLLGRFTVLIAVGLSPVKFKPVETGYESPSNRAPALKDGAMCREARKGGLLHCRAVGVIYRIARDQIRRKTVGGFSLKPTAKLFGAHQCNEPNQPPSRGFPEGHIATTVHGVVRVEQLNEGRF